MRLKLSRTRRFELPTSFLAARSVSHSLKCLLRTTYESWSYDNGPRLAAALAYYTMFSLAPLLVIATAIAGAALGQRPVETALVAQFYGLVGRAGATAIEGILHDLQKPGMSTVAGIAGSVLLLIGASAVFVELEDALNTIWCARKLSCSLRTMVVDRLLGFGLVMVAEGLLIASVLLTAAAATLGRIAAARWPGFGVSFRLVGILASLVMTTVLFSMLFKFLPKTPIEWRDVWPAALVTAVMFDAGKLLIALYLGKSRIISAYGAASSLVIVVGWVYYSALILYFGAEFAKVYAQAYGSLAPLELPSAESGQARVAS
jgi:membrane protein